ncbi:type I-C CRISPR-associated protein Cas5c [Alysiella filiformis]|uniref:pre-crRNA processing endonuclease n=1 Tax=Alysiella filiformis DSM 16848 TaxID=1120981 RepID=A0A286ECH9_9NEIS|nr:type I-C CRISPR-associated protein Cas5c [Alysiella filiformis]QMT30553.1 type I-C CRISPR-associated protein Cas5 [Alysiella filiformis]UBQ56467.1 type I-C CRISPR-associated protein Cas5c [Alysiella filiformis DSM 16848]SOD68622.1 CRISPR-associated protein Cas5d [Alysiella filiformis DSM 16848]
MNNTITFRVWGRQARFTDPITNIGGEKFTYHIPTYEAIKGILKSIYWKPTLIWHIKRIRVMKPIRTQSKSTKPKEWNGGNTLAIYTFLQDVEYQVEAYFTWNENWDELKEDRIAGKHMAIAQRMLERGGRQDVFLGARDCQGYVAPCTFGDGQGFYDDIDNLDFGLMFHSFGYPEETGKNELISRFWAANMAHGIVEFPSVHDSGSLKTRFIREMKPEKPFQREKNVKSVENEAKELGL